NMLASLDKSDAQLFTNLCSFGIELPRLTPLIYETEENLYNQLGINFNSLTHLDAIGLIRIEALGGFQKKGIPQKGFVKYFESTIELEFAKPDKNNFDIGKVILTKAGEQLAPICGATEVTGFADYLKAKWK